MAIIATVNAKSGKAEEFLARKGEQIRNDIFTEMKKIAVDLQAYVKGEKLSGQVLKNRTGNLRRAITEQATKTADAIMGIVGVAPNAAAYAAIHEFGGTIHIPAVEGTLMVFPSKGAPPTRFSKSGKALKGLKGFSFDQLVFTTKHRAFDVKMPERSYMRSSLRENKNAFLSRLSETVRVSAAKTRT
jgi:phage gpG-like protein